MILQKMDKRLIVYVQWAVRQFELFTKLKRNDLADRLFTLNRLCLLMIYASTIATVFAGVLGWMDITSALPAVLLCYFASKHHDPQIKNLVRKVHDQKEGDHRKEILYGGKIRGVFVFSVIAQSLLYLIVIFRAEIPLVSLLFTWAPFMLMPSIQIPLGYLLCTSSISEEQSTER